MQVLVTDNLTGETRLVDVPDEPSVPIETPPPVPTIEERIAAVEATIDALTGAV